MSLLVSHLEEIQESDKLSTIGKEVITILLASINDWPNQIISLVDYETEIFKRVGEEIDKKKLEDYISKIDYSESAWEAESLTQLIEVYKYYDEKKSLSEILKEVKKEIER